MLHNLGLVKAAQGNNAAAERFFRQSLSLSRRITGEDHPDTASSLSALATTLIDQERYASAEPLLQEALSIYEKALPEGHKDIGLTQSKLGACLGMLDREDEAEPLLLAGLETLRQTRGLPHKSTQDALRRLVDFYEARGFTAKAMSYKSQIIDAERTP